MTSRVTYWDTSALVATLFVEKRSAEARARAGSPGVHLMSSLAWAELHAVLARARRTGSFPEARVDAMQAAVVAGPWHYVNTAPRQDVCQSLARRWGLRGADLWHLALAKTLCADLPELTFAVYDARLAEAAAGEGLLIL